MFDNIILCHTFTHNMATVNYRLRSNSNKDVQIYAYLSLGRGAMIQSKTGFTINPKNWSESTKRPKQNTAENKVLFNNLKKLETYIYNLLNESNSIGEITDKFWLDNAIQNCFERAGKKATDSTLLTTHIEYIIDNANTRKISGSNKIGLSARRVISYKSFLKTVSNYQRKIKRQIQFSDINKPFVDSLINWLMNEQMYSVNYSGKIVDNLKTVCLDAQKMGKKVNPYVEKIESFSESSEDRNIVTLTFEELDQIRNTPLSKQSLINARKWLIIGCEIGQRGGDLLNITKKSIRYNKNFLYLDVLQQKTGKSVTIGVPNKYVIDILENELPTKISSQKLNVYLKELCKAAEINEVIEGKKINPITKRKEIGQYPKWQLISSHVCRRSFATNYYKKIPTPILIEITGHSKESLFLDYINKSKDKDENANLFMKFYEEINN